VRQGELRTRFSGGDRDWGYSKARLGGDRAGVEWSGLGDGPEGYPPFGPEARPPLLGHEGAEGALAFPTLRAIPGDAADLVWILRLIAGAASEDPRSGNQNGERNEAHAR